MVKFHTGEYPDSCIFHSSSLNCLNVRSVKSEFSNFLMAEPPQNRISRVDFIAELATDSGTLRSVAKGKPRLIT